MNCISFCTNETLIKFRKSKAFRSGLLKHLILIRPDANPDKFSTATLKELLNSLKKNIPNIHNCREFFEKICYDFDVKLSIFNSNYTENPKYFLNYVKIIFILIIITFDEENITLIQTGDAIAKRLLSLSEENGHQNIGDLKVTVLHTGLINLDMIENILENKNIEIRKCEI